MFKKKSSRKPQCHQNKRLAIQQHTGVRGWSGGRSPVCFNASIMICLQLFFSLILKLSSVVVNNIQSNRAASCRMLNESWEKFNSSVSFEEMDQNQTHTRISLRLFLRLVLSLTWDFITQFLKQKSDVTTPSSMSHEPMSWLVNESQVSKSVSQWVNE